MIDISCKWMNRLFLSCVLVTLIGCSAELTDIEYLDRAKDSIDKKDYVAAILDLKSALEKNSENAEARWELGRLYLEIGNLTGAEKEFLLAQKYGVNDEAVLPYLAQVYLPLGKYDAVYELKVGSTFNKTTQANLQASKALAFLTEGKLVNAEKYSEAALKNNPDLPYAKYTRAAYLLGSGNTDLARQELEKLTALHSDYAPAWSLLGSLERQTNNIEAAELAYGKAIANRLNNSNDLLSRALVRIYLNKLDLAKQDIALLKQRTTDSPDLFYVEGLVSFVENNYPAAEQLLSKVVTSDKRNNAAIYYLGAAHYYQGHIEQAQNYLSRVISVAPGFLPARRMLAAQNVKLKNFSAVERLIRPVVNEKTDDLVLINLLADALMAQGKTEEGLVWLRRAEELQPESAEAKARLGQGLFAGGESKNAAELLDAAIQLDPLSQQADTVLIESFLRTRDYGMALQAAESFVSRQPENPIAHNLYGLVQLTQGRDEYAEQEFEKALQISPGYPDAAHNLAQLAIKNSEYKKAENLYQEVLKYQQNNLETLIKYAALKALQGDKQGMRDLLQRATESHPGQDQPRILLAKTYLVDKEPSKAFAVIEKYSGDLEANPEIVGILGQIHLQNGANREASRTFARLVERYPGSVQANFLLGVAYSRLGEAENMERAFVRTLELEENHVLARIALTRIQIIQGRADDAKENLKRLKAIIPDNPDVLQLEATLATAGK